MYDWKFDERTGGIFTGRHDMFGVEIYEGNKVETPLGIGIVRYNAYRDTSSDLSFAIALLDEANNGIVLNGIYSREMSNIYAKPIQNGKSSYIMTQEEQDAVFKAMNEDVKEIK